MAIAKTTNRIELNNSEKHIKIQFLCPVCKSEKELLINKSIINKAKQLTTVSIPKNKICQHHFQAFVDKNFKVRGYQKVDFAFEPDTFENKQIYFYNVKKDDNELFKNLLIKANYLEYYPNDAGKHAQNEIKVQMKKKEPTKGRKLRVEKKEMTLEEIYEQFWEFIDDDNQEFREFIIKDPRRGNKIS